VVLGPRGPNPSLIARDYSARRSTTHQLNRPYPAICSVSSVSVGTLKTPGLVSVWQVLGMFDRAFARGSHLDTLFGSLKRPKTP
jgi:hypothetical protein